MVVFPNCKINLGLHVLRKRADGFHDIETVFYPVGWCDALEAVAAPGTGGVAFTVSGADAGLPEKNLVLKAHRLLAETRRMPALMVHLHKHIPAGAGLGGGSSDAAFMLRLMNDLLKLEIPEPELESHAARLGSDCAFFLRNRPVLATGRGEVMEEIGVDLDKYYILVSYPGIHSDTAAAFRGIVPKERTASLRNLVALPVAEWRHRLVNDFEATVCKVHPAIEALKIRMYDHGAIYAAMSGSGSAVYGIFSDRPPASLVTGTHYLHEPQSSFGKPTRF